MDLDRAHGEAYYRSYKEDELKIFSMGFDNMELSCLDKTFALKKVQLEGIDLRYYLVLLVYNHLEFNFLLLHLVLCYWKFRIKAS